MNSDHPVRTLIIVWGGLLGSITLQQVGAIAGLCVAIATLIYTALQIYVLWRDEVVKYRVPGARERSGDSGPGSLI